MVAPGNTLGKGLFISGIVMLALIMSSVVVSLLRHLVPYSIRLPALLLISTTTTAVLHTFAQACCYELSADMGVYLPVIAVNTLLLAQLQEFALRKPLLSTLAYNFFLGIGIIFLVSTIGGIRELLVYGDLSNSVHLLFGTATQDGDINPVERGQGAAILAMAPGAFLLLGLVAAMVNLLLDRFEQFARRA